MRLAVQVFLCVALANSILSVAGSSCSATNRNQVTDSYCTSVSLGECETTYVVVADQGILCKVFGGNCLSFERCEPDSNSGPPGGWYTDFAKKNNFNTCNQVCEANSMKCDDVASVAQMRTIPSKDWTLFNAAWKAIKERKGEEMPEVKCKDNYAGLGSGYSGWPLYICYPGNNCPGDTNFKGTVDCGGGPQDNEGIIPKCNNQVRHYGHHRPFCWCVPA